MMEETDNSLTGCEMEFVKIKTVEYEFFVRNWTPRPVAADNVNTPNPDDAEQNVNELQHAFRELIPEQPLLPADDAEQNVNEQQHELIPEQPLLPDDAEQNVNEQQHELIPEQPLLPDDAEQNVNEQQHELIPEQLLLPDDAEQNVNEQQHELIPEQLLLPDEAPGWDQSDLTTLEKWDGSSPTENFETLHQKRTNGERAPEFACSHIGCLKMFSNNKALRKHLKIHGPRTFICAECGKAFTDNSTLKIHQLVHIGENPFQCTIEGCGKRLKTTYSLRLHLKLHTGDRPFACHVDGCNKTYIQAGGLRTHLLTHTRKERNLNYKRKSAAVLSNNKVILKKTTFNQTVGHQYMLRKAKATRMNLVARQH